MDHLLVTCSFAILNWTSIIGWFDCSWVLPNSLGLLYHAWYGSRLHQETDYVEGFVHCGPLVDLETGDASKGCLLRKMSSDIKLNFK